jgi:hypothetical protein
MSLFNVQEPPFCAVCNGVTDDTVAIQAAIDTAALTGGAVLLPGFSVVSGLVLKSNVALLGYAPQASGLILAGGADADVIQTPQGTIRASVKHMRIDGRRSQQIAEDICGVNVLSSQTSPSGDIDCDDLEIVDCRFHGLQLCEGVNGARINAVRVEGTDLGAGIELSRGNGGGKGITVSQCRIRNTQKGSVQATSAILHSSIIGNICGISGNQGGKNISDNITAYNVGNRFLTVQGNTCEQSGNHGIHVAGLGISVIGNVIDRPTNCGIAIGGTYQEPTLQSFRIAVIGNAINSPLQYGIWVENTRELTIIGNPIAGCIKDAIKLREDVTITAADFFTLIGNTMKSNGGWGAYLDGAGRGVIDGNAGNANTLGGLSQINIPAGRVNLVGQNHWS